MAYKKYWNQLPPLTIYSDEIDDIFGNERIIKYHKYLTQIEYFLGEFGDADYMFPRISHPSFIRHYINKFLNSSSPHILTSMLLHGNTKGSIQLCRSLLQYDPEIFSRSLNESPLKSIFNQHRALFHVVDDKIELPRTTNLHWMLQLSVDDDGLNIVQKLYEKFNQPHVQFVNDRNFYMFFLVLLKFGCDVQISQMVKHEKFSQLQLTLTLGEYKKLTVTSQELLASHTSFGHCQPESYHIFVNIGYNDWNTYLSEIPQYVEEWFDHSSNPAILADICQNHFNYIYQRKYSTPYRFTNPTLLGYIAPQTDIDYLAQIPLEFAETGMLDLPYMKSWVSAVSQYYTQDAWSDCLNRCFLWTLWNTITDQRRQLLDYLVEYGVQWPLRNSQFPNLKAYLDVHHLDTLSYLLDHAYPFTYDDICLLYISLGQDCQTYPRQFKTVVSRMRRTYLNG